VRIQVLFFGRLKDLVGRAQDQLDLDGPAGLETVWSYYERQFPALAELRPSVVFAKNQQFSRGQELLTDGDEVAFLPPVSGGSGLAVSPWIQVREDADHFFALTRSTIDLNWLRNRVLRPEDGAVNAFEGVVRNNTKGRPTKFLDYECYEAMAIGVMEQIGREIAASHAIGRIAMVHRLGRMEIGETSVAVVVSAPHRKPSFEAALEGINRLKKLVPIWKKEHFVDGEVWVDGEWDDSVLQR
jgi:MoaE-MoaD fusion protein